MRWNLWSRNFDEKGHLVKDSLTQETFTNTPLSVEQAGFVGDVDEENDIDTYNRIWISCLFVGWSSICWFGGSEPHGRRILGK